MSKERCTVLIYGTIQIESVVDYTDELLNIEIKLNGTVVSTFQKSPVLVQPSYYSKSSQNIDY